MFFKKKYVSKSTKNPNIFENRKKILNSYLLYCLEQNDLGHTYSRTLKHVFGINKGMPHARKYRKLILETMQQNNLQNNLEDLVSLV